jgi:hypothetical protein
MATLARSVSPFVEKVGCVSQSEGMPPSMRRGWTSAIDAGSVSQATSAGLNRAIPSPIRPSACGHWLGCSVHAAAAHTSTATAEIRRGIGSMRGSMPENASPVGVHCPEMG